MFLLLGIVKKNAILIIDFALELPSAPRGLEAVEAVREACLLRFRPILMTTLAAALGALPLAIGFGEGAELRRPLGVAIIGGLIASQLLTLLTTPVVYVLLDKLRRRKRAPAGPTARRDRGAGGGVMARRFAPLLAASLVVALAGCALGPDYVRPRRAECRLPTRGRRSPAARSSYRQRPPARSAVATGGASSTTPEG